MKIEIVASGEHLDILEAQIELLIKEWRHKGAQVELTVHK